MHVVFTRCSARQVARLSRDFFSSVTNRALEQGLRATLASPSLRSMLQKMMLTEVFLTGGFLHHQYVTGVRYDAKSGFSYSEDRLPLSHNMCCTPFRSEFS